MNLVPDGTILFSYKKTHEKMSEFLTNITAPVLGSATFATDLREVFQNIDDNFKKIVSAPYLEGQEGRSIEAVDLYMVEDGELTEFGKAAVRELFGNPYIETIEDIDNLCPSVGSTPEHSASEYLVEHPTVKVLAKYNPDTGKIEDYICSAEYYCYLDMRVEDLSHLQYPSTQQTFVDYTSQLFGEYSGGTWTFTKGVMLPTLYFNSDQGYFCWKINSAETGIRAQGIKGDDGRPPLAAVVRGVGRVATIGDSTVVRITVTEYSALVTQVVEGELVTQSSWQPITSSDLQNGDMVACVFTTIDSEYNIVYPDMVLGNVVITGEDSSRLYTITLPEANRFSSLWKSYLLFYAFQDVDYKSTDSSKTKAIFVPAATEGITHAIFQDDSSVRYSRVSSGWVSEDTSGEDNLIFKKVRESRLIGSASMGDANKMTAPDDLTDFTSSAKFSGYNLEVEGTAKSEVSGVPGVLLGVPVGSVVSWIDTSRIPEGWYLTGELSEPAPPVFGMRYTGIEAEDYDVVVKNGESAMKKMIFTGITGDGDIGERSLKFSKIFCVLTGYALESPIEIQTEETTYENFLSVERFQWNSFDLDASPEGLKFYLTKLI